ncbi:MAG: cellulase family glycosylhydrolase [Kiritimatiellae bacterium]|nr:cellulase family glycosylhydrolase [Kiritimatiellia bacterium]
MKKIGLMVLCLTTTCAARTVPFTNLNWRLTRHARIEGNLLVVDVPPDKAREGGCGVARVDMSAFSGKCFIAQIVARGERISKPRQSWNGLKFMFHYKNPETGTEQWPNTHSRLGDFPTQTITVSDAQQGRKLTWVDLTLGLQDSSGKVVFDLSTLAIAPQEALYPVTNQDYRVSYPERVRNLPRLRGVMLPGGPCKEDDFRTLRDWGATLARYQMTRHFAAIGADRDLAEYDRWLDGKLDHLERDVLPWAAKYGIKIVVDLHCPPGGRDPDKDWTMYYDAKYADHFVECWRRIATRFRGRPEIYGFDLVNEPTQTRRATCDYWTLQKRAAEAIRAIDPETTIIVESNGWDSADTFAYLSPLAMDNVIYQVHMYQPHAFTHQGVHASGDYAKFAYPDEKRGWNVDFIRARLAPVRAFEKKHGAKIYVGEFSAITWAEGAGPYIADCIAVFEEYGWDWTYHAFREWNGWSVEHEVDGSHGKFKASADNPRRRALLDGLRRDPRR